MALDPVLGRFIESLNRSAVPPVGSGTVADARARAAMLAQRTDRGPGVDEVFNLEIAGRGGHAIPARLLRPDGVGGTLVVMLHGGGWTTGTIDEYEPLARAMAAATRCPVLVVGYRLAPEHRFPAAVEDCVDAVEWAARSLAGGRELVLMGDSAGGNLAAVVCQIARDRGGPRIA
ncbi:MAG: alpha/beta hydrolase fold domain-containing protein, partial [Gluconacetobacter diazotrophicus]|nr:alpha/beta hydrolase fold domain-containing protein [Gluconacetobacter diazotrophicus]